MGTEETWEERYERAVGMLLLGRIRRTVALCLGGIAFAGVIVFVTQGANRVSRLAFLTMLAAGTLGIGAASLLPEAPARARRLATVYGAVLATALAVYGLAVPSMSETASMGLVAAVMGVAILLPVGQNRQLAVSIVALCGYGALALREPHVAVPGSFSVMACTAGVAVAAAALFERYHRDSFRHALQQERLVALSRDLTASVELNDVVGHLLRHSLVLIPGELATLSLRHDNDGVYRMEHLDGLLVEEFRWMAGVEMPADSPLITDLVARDTFLLPDDDPDGAMVRLTATNRDRLPHTLHATLRHAGQAIGVLTWSRGPGYPFAPDDRRLARAIVDQGSVALRTIRLIADIQQASRLKSQFVSTVSHELRTPLNVILGYTEIVRDQLGPDHEGIVPLQRVEEAGRDLLTLIESTLEVGRLEASRSPLRPEPVALAEFWDGLGEAVRRIPRGDRVALVWEPLSAPLTLVTDPHKLSVVIRNLVGNALKFTSQGQVRAEAIVEDGAVVVRVRDTGCGIRREDQAVIFELFRQADGSDVRRYGGTGLGLYIVRCFVEQLAGTVSVESAPGRGSTFTVRLPVAESLAGVSRAA